MFLYDTEDDILKGILVYVSAKNNLSAEDSLNELAELSKTAGIEVVGEIVQNLDKANNKTYIGKGKLDELDELISDTEATCIICDDELTSIQLKNLEEIFEGKIILDRTSVILEIFSKRATSAEGKLQVELARLKYRRAHLLGKGVSMSRQGGGSSAINRGAGETKLEIDKRLINNKIAFLNKELKEIMKHRDTLRNKHSKNKIPTVSLVGYTNAGKSTLLNALSGSTVLAENMLFATLDTTTRQVILDNGGKILLVDTVGFIQKLPHHLIDAFKSTLEELQYADIIIHVVDITSSIVDEQMNTVYQTLKMLKCEKPVITVYNKSDIGTDIHNPIDNNSLCQINISAKENIGLDKLTDEVENILKTFRKYIEIILPYNEGSLLRDIHEFGEIEKEEYLENGIYIEMYCTDKVFNKAYKYKK